MHAIDAISILGWRQFSYDCWRLTEPQEKCAAIQAFSFAPEQNLTFGQPQLITTDMAQPGHPAQPELVAPSAVPKRSLHTTTGRAALIHALAHIEFNAINLALDIVWRFADLPADFYRDWLRVAQEEAHHFCLLNQHLHSLGYAYGDFPAHNGLWEMAALTRDNVLARLALVPRVLEARGLDVTPGIRSKLMQAGDDAGAAILEVILRDEIGHVKIGNHWFNWLCRQQGFDPIAHAAHLATQYQAPRQRGPFNHPARLAAGFTASELASLEKCR
ncbi:ferritin-like domain-containing protein [Parvibium lacunae]|uniref:DUF455 family protein n=1 Tax=Parvibium lacunae TaxID=1888893 RepID=A0A368L852_9BURK|nr:ferritin-like domain-containing protein [Parvibium lacunae]RCS59833.1 DUF455 family protein [Parvibium lacunae]